MVRKEINGNGCIIYYNDKNQYHREDGPAIEWSNGNKWWCINGFLHRIDGPAIVDIDPYNNVYYIMGKEYSSKDWLAIKDFPLLW